MDKELKAKWVKALTSGRYKQGKGALKRDGGYCCLGVLREVTPLNYGPKGNSNWFLSDKEVDACGLTKHIQRRLAKLNDDEVPFDMIASLIDAAL